MAEVTEPPLWLEVQGLSWEGREAGVWGGSKGVVWGGVCSRKRVTAGRGGGLPSVTKS